jgi:uncharacterized protein (DUF2126 family)
VSNFEHTGRKLSAIITLRTRRRGVLVLADLRFHVSWNRPGASWVVRIGDELYGAYLTKELAVLDAADVADEAQAKGHNVQVSVD